MKKIQNIFLVLSLLLFSCNNEDALDCVKTSGDAIENEISVPRFSAIHIYDNMNLVVKQGVEQKVVLKTGENLVSKINLEVTDQALTLRNENTCNWVRSFTNPEVHITTDSLTEIVLYGFGTIRSEGILSFPNIRLESFEGPGDFYMDLDCQIITTISNDLCNMYLNGKAQTLNVRIFANDGRFEGENLIAQNINVTHDGSNVMIVHPVKKLSGRLNSTGDIVYINSPKTLDIEVNGSGKLLQR